jgi:hypothetical protein
LLSGTDTEGLDGNLQELRYLTWIVSPSGHLSSMFESEVVVWVALVVEAARKHAVSKVAVYMISIEEESSMKSKKTLGCRQGRKTTAGIVARLFPSCECYIWWLLAARL